MKPEFENGLATQPGEIRCFYYDAMTCEYTGWSDEYINIGVSMPADSTDIEPGEGVAGKVAVFSGSGWEWMEDLRGETVYSTKDGSEANVDYIGPVRDGFTLTPPFTPFDSWNGSSWVTDTVAQHVADVAEAEQDKANLLAVAQQKISLWQTDLLLGTITDENRTRLIAWRQYMENVQATDTAAAPGLSWPVPPEV